MRKARVSFACRVRPLHRTAVGQPLQFLVAALALLLCACATPAQHFSDEAASLGFASGIVEGDGFRHVVYFERIDEPADALHVYIEHDGTPWIGGTRVSDDPTPRTPFALELMARDHGPRLFLGRPCYFETSRDAGCSARMWTQRRYAPEVVASMAAALRAFLVEHPYRHVMLIGYSGGGTLAWLIASRVPQTRAVVTIAANLDTQAWTALHGYSPMKGSLDPAREPALPKSIVHVAYVGGQDKNVMPAILQSFAVHHPETKVSEIAPFDHTCCWIERWPALIEDVERSMR